MKNIINYYYDVSADNIIYVNDNKYFFEYKNEYFILEEIKDMNVDEIYRKNVTLMNFGIKCNTIVLTKFFNPYISYESKNYILYKTYKNYNDIITIKNVIDFNKQIRINNKEISNYNNLLAISHSWKKIWENKIDYYENDLTDIILKFPKYFEIIDYFIGMAENSIQIIGDLQVANYYAQHYRLNKNSTFYDLYDSKNIVFDSIVRDVSEYIKSYFDSSNFNEIKTTFNEFTKYVSFNNEESIYLISRILFPTYFFDKLDEITMNSENDIDKGKNAIFFDNIHHIENNLKLFVELLQKKGIITNFIPNWLNKTS